MSIGVIGDFILDVEQYCSSIYTTPESKDVPVLNPGLIKYKLGGAANTAENIHNLYDDCKLYCSVNPEDISRKTNILQNNPLPMEIIRSKFRPIEKHRIYMNGKLLCRLDYDYGVEPVNNSLEQSIVNNNHEVIVISDYGKGTITNYKKILDSALYKKHKIIVDPKGDFQKYRGAFIIKPNKKELEEYLGYEIYDLASTLNHIKEDVIYKKEKSVFTNLCDNLIVTDGANGAYCLNFANERIIHYLTKDINVVDTIGAGDSFTAGLAIGVAKYGMSGYRYEEGKVIDLAMNMANIVVTKQGTARVEKNEIRI